MGTYKRRILEEELILTERSLSYGDSSDGYGVALSHEIKTGSSPVGGAARISIRPGLDFYSFEISSNQFSETESRSEPCFVLVLILEGTAKGSFKKNNKTFDITYRADNCYLSDARLPVNDRISLAEKEKIRLIQLKLSPDFLKKISFNDFEKQLHQNHPLNIFSSEGYWLGEAMVNDKLIKIAEQLFEYSFTENTKKDYQFEAGVLKVLDSCLALFVGDEYFDALSSLDKTRLKKVVQRIKSDCSKKWSNQDLADIAGVSEKKLYHLFDIAFKQTPYAYVQQVKLTEAHDLISQHGCNVTQAALSVGYDSLSHFSQLFKREFGVSPSNIK